MIVSVIDRRSNLDLRRESLTLGGLVHLVGGHSRYIWGILVVSEEGCLWISRCLGLSRQLSLQSAFLALLRTIFSIELVATLCRLVIVIVAIPRLEVLVLDQQGSTAEQYNLDDEETHRDPEPSVDNVGVCKGLIELFLDLD